MQTATTINHDYPGPTRNPHGAALKRLVHQFRNVRGPEQVRQCLRVWGLSPEISPRQARFWADSTGREARVFCDLAGVSRHYSGQPWEDIPQDIRERLWRAVVDATQWGERLRGRF